MIWPSKAVNQPDPPPQVLATPPHTEGVTMLLSPLEQALYVLPVPCLPHQNTVPIFNNQRRQPEGTQGVAVPSAARGGPRILQLECEDGVLPATATDQAEAAPEAAKNVSPSPCEPS